MAGTGRSMMAKRNAYRPTQDSKNGPAGKHDETEIGGDEGKTTTKGSNTTDRWRENGGRASQFL